MFIKFKNINYIVIIFNIMILSNSIAYNKLFFGIYGMTLLLLNILLSILYDQNIEISKEDDLKTMVLTWYISGIVHTMFLILMILFILNKFNILI